MYGLTDLTLPARTLDLIGNILPKSQFHQVHVAIRHISVTIVV